MNGGRRLLRLPPGRCRPTCGLHPRLPGAGLGVGPRLPASPFGLPGVQVPGVQVMEKPEEGEEGAQRDPANGLESTSKTKQDLFSGLNFTPSFWSENDWATFQQDVRTTGADLLTRVCGGGGAALHSPGEEGTGTRPSFILCAPHPC